MRIYIEKKKLNMKYKILKSNSGIVNPIDRIQARFSEEGGLARQALQPCPPLTPKFDPPSNKQPNKSFCSFSRLDNVGVRSLLMFAHRELKIAPFKWLLSLWERGREREKEGENESENACNVYVRVRFLLAGTQQANKVD